MERAAICRGCSSPFSYEAGKGRPRSLCDTCRPPEERTQGNASAKRTYAWGRLTKTCMDLQPEIIAAGLAALEVQTPTRGVLVSRLQALGKTESRVGRYRGLIAVAGVALAMAARVRPIAPPSDTDEP